MKKLLFYVVTCAVSLSLLVLLAHKFNGISEIRDWLIGLTFPRVFAVLAGFLTGTVNLAVLGLRFSFSLRLFGIRERTGRLILIQAIGYALGSFLPGGMGNEMARMSLLKSFSESRSPFVRALAFDRAVPMATYLLTFVALFPYWAPEFLAQFQLYTYVIATFLTLFALLIFCMIFGPKILVKLSLDSGEGHVSLLGIARSPLFVKTLLAVPAIAMCNYCLTAFCYYCYILAIPGANIPVQLVCLLPLSIGLIALIPFTLNGIGPREAFLVYCFSQAGNTSAGVLFSFLLLLGTIYGSLLGLLALWWHSGRNERRVEQTSAQGN